MVVVKAGTESWPEEEELITWLLCCLVALSIRPHQPALQTSVSSTLPHPNLNTKPLTAKLPLSCVRASFSQSPLPVSRHGRRSLQALSLYAFVSLARLYDNSKVDPNLTQPTDPYCYPAPPLFDAALRPQGWGRRCVINECSPPKFPHHHPPPHSVNSIESPCFI